MTNTLKLFILKSTQNQEMHSKEKIQSARVEVLTSVLWIQVFPEDLNLQSLVFVNVKLGVQSFTTVI